MHTWMLEQDSPLADELDARAGILDKRLPKKKCQVIIFLKGFVHDVSMARRSHIV
jgi:hypothetical protein